MSIHKRKDTKKTSYQSRWTDPNGIRRSKDFPTRQAAEQFEKEMRINVRRGDYSDPQSGKTKVSDVYNEWLKNSLHLKPKTKASYLSLWKTMVEPTWGKRKINSITRSEVKTWITQSTSSTGRKVSASRMRQSYALLKLILDQAVDMNLISRNPASSGTKGSMKKILPKDLTTKKSKVLEMTELISLSEEMKEYKLLVLMAGMLGLRWAELIALTPRDFDFKKNQISVNKSLTEVNGKFEFVTPKSGKNRNLPIPTVLSKELRTLVLSTELDSIIFKSPKGKMIRHSNFMRRYFEPALSKLNLEDMTFHDLRHTAISQAIASGADVLAVSKIAGHSNPAITLKVYTHELDGSLTSVQNAIDEQFLEAQRARFVPDGGKWTA